MSYRGRSTLSSVAVLSAWLLASGLAETVGAAECVDKTRTASADYALTVVVNNSEQTLNLGGEFYKNNEYEPLPPGDKDEHRRGHIGARQEIEQVVKLYAPGSDTILVTCSYKVKNFANTQYHSRWHNWSCGYDKTRWAEHCPGCKIGCTKTWDTSGSKDSWKTRMVIRGGDE